MIVEEKIPLSLYVHIPWCLKKCPYCDFNSYPTPYLLPEKEYLTALLMDLKISLATISNRELHSIYIGGGTPTLLSPQAIAGFLNNITSLINCKKNIEITIEANPGTINKKNLHDLHTAGINRLSIGIQSLQNEKLKLLGRIHNKNKAINAVKTAQAAGFSNINIDLIYGLPNQTVKDAIYDIQTALSLNPTHLSWYQLTIEPNTGFYKNPPELPDENALHDIEKHGQQIIKQNGFNQYEISAYCTGEVSSPSKFQCQHNLNYWQFGDYIGIGAGAHSKITHNNVIRTSKYRSPEIYMEKFIEAKKILTQKDLILEFMMNTLRLNKPIPVKLFASRTGLGIDAIKNNLSRAQKQGFIKWDDNKITVTTLGRKFLNKLLMTFA